MISDEKFAVSRELMEQAYSYLRDGYEQALNALEEAETENVKLRELLQRTWNAECIASLEELMEELQAENAKLRELVDYMTPIALYVASEQEREHMRELGVEVDG